jgi:cell wall assembly regulator SMI1
MPISQSRHAPLTSVATSAVDSRPDLHSSGDDEPSKQATSSATALSGSLAANGSPIRRPYSPGVRSLSSSSKTGTEESVRPGEIQMQSFADGTPPPPPPSHSWKKIDRWAEKNYEELGDQLGQGCTQNDINELEHELDCSLPQDVRDSLCIHDGQERGGRPTGIIFGCMLLDCEEIVQEWKNWKVVNEEYLSALPKPQPSYPLKSLNGTSASSSTYQTPSANINSKAWRTELLDRQDSQPPRAIAKAYSHPSWIPLARDWGGNCIAVDLAPGPLGRWGQVILFGRDYDTKYVVARSWTHFLATVADDISSDKVFVVEESGELKLKEFKTDNVEPGYLDILRWRADQKYGRRVKRKTDPKPPGLNTNVKSGGSPRDSPYGSPTVGNDERGRSPQRFPRGLSNSPRHAVGSPLARVAEESIVAPVPMRVGGDIVKDFATMASSVEPTTNGLQQKPSKLVDAPTPIATAAPLSPFQRKRPEKLVDAPTPISAPNSAEFPSTGLKRVTTMERVNEGENKENTRGSNEMNSAKKVVKGLGGVDLDGEMKTVQI